MSKLIPLGAIWAIENLGFDYIHCDLESLVIHPTIDFHEQRHYIKPVVAYYDKSYHRLIFRFETFTSVREVRDILKKSKEAIALLDHLDTNSLCLYREIDLVMDKINFIPQKSQLNNTLQSLYKNTAAQLRMSEAALDSLAINTPDLTKVPIVIGYVGRHRK